jgi:23S rRNA (uracil1939-C5)-methyltransferase
MLYIARMRKGEVVEVEVTTLDEDGAGVGALGEVSLHVAGAAPDERVRAAVEHRSPHRPDAWARLVEIVRPSPLRVQPACRAYGPCGGCRLEHVDYAAQLAWKRDFTARALGGLVEVEACVASPKPLGYRNREKRVYAILDGQRVLGAYAPRSHEVIDLAGCAVSEPPLDEVATTLASLLDGVPPYDETTGAGHLRYAILRVNHAGRVLVVLVTAGGEFPVEIARALVAARPEVAGVVQNVNPTRGNVLVGPESRALIGEEKIVERVGEVQLQLSATAFFQVNRAMAARLYADARAAATLDGSARVVDAYSGVGGLALTLAPGARSVLGIESHPGAVEDARASAALNGIPHARFVAGDAAQLADEPCDLLVLNPPRKGCTPSVLAAVVRARPLRVVYVSCSPETLARDLADLAEHGYRAKWARPYDMLPQTPHVEVLTLLERDG